MRSPIVKRLRWGLPPVLLLASALLALPEFSASVAGAATAGQSGLLCTTSASPNASFSLATTTGWVKMADGNTVFMWGFSPNSSGQTLSYQAPGPTLCVNQGDAVTVSFTNTACAPGAPATSCVGEPVSIVFLGQEAVTADGVSAEPQFDTLGNLTSLVPAAPVGGSVTYKFTAGQPGTYIYESATDPGKQVQMGLFGMVIVRPAGHPDWAYNDAATQFNPSTEFMLLFTEVDPFLHLAVERSQAYDITQLHSRYWMINGRTFPDTIQVNGSATLPQQPQGSLIRIHPKDASNPLPALVRYASVGDHDYPFHPHGMHGRVIARDARELMGGAGEDLSYEKFTVLMGMGQTLDAMYIFTDIEKWNPTSNPIPVALPQQQNLTYKDSATWFSGSPYLGFMGPLPAGVTQYNQCGEFYEAWHNHDLYQAANYDAGFGGQFTLERIDPPLPNSCP